ncbi:hypothetical protein BJ322DRAFT_1076237 [Thelephora terrestris]|uniref:FAR-17a/AIG1-like protein n=1 Tax=Thelephora terrestris TaxID=56493 RepID=A0A9P6H9S0_9AGAM|nr:hypothetical protein BJ322DRAFT_1076237 [Thelephora terrestris]
MDGVYSKFGVGVPFDPELSLVTSPVYSPFLLATIRLLFGFYYLLTFIFWFSWESVHSPVDVDQFFSYFTHLSAIGLCAYFWAAGVQTTAYARWNKYPLRHWPRLFQLLHLGLTATVITFPFVVTIAYWGLLASSTSFSTPFNAWENTSLHILNSVFALSEILLTFVGPIPWLYLPICVLTIGLYIALAYVSHATQNFYPYKFLDPAQYGGQVAAYVFGVLIGECIIFAVVYGLSKLRNIIFAKRRTSTLADTSLGEKSQAGHV